MKRAPDINRGDLAHRKWLQQRLRQLRVDGETELAAVASQLHVTFHAVSAFERRANHNPQIITVQRYARAIGYRADLRIDNLPTCTDDPDVDMFTRLANRVDPSAADDAARSLALARLIAARRALGRSQRETAAALGCDASSLCEIERRDRQPLLSTYQRYARVLGGRLQVKLTPAPTVDEVAVRRALDGKGRFRDLNDAERVVLFRDHAHRLPQQALMERLGISGTVYAQWRDRVGVAA